MMNRIASQMPGLAKKVLITSSRVAPMLPRPSPALATLGVAGSARTWYSPSSAIRPPSSRNTVVQAASMPKRCSSAPARIRRPPSEMNLAALKKAPCQPA